MLTRLVKDAFLISDGVGRGTVYCVPWQDRRALTAFDDAGAPSLTPELGAKTPELSVKTPELGTKTPELGAKTPELNTFLEWQAIPEGLQIQLQAIANPIASRGKVDATVLRQAVVALCQGHYLGLRVLARALQRDSDDLRKRTLTPMVQEGVLRSAYPTTRNPRQAYTANTTKSDS